MTKTVVVNYRPVRPSPDREPDHDAEATVVVGDRPAVVTVPHAAGRVRFATPGLRHSPPLAVAVEDAVEGVAGVRQAHAYPRTGHVVVWFDPARTDRTWTRLACGTEIEVDIAHLVLGDEVVVPVDGVVVGNSSRLIRYRLG